MSVLRLPLVSTAGLLCLASFYAHAQTPAASEDPAEAAPAAAAPDTSVAPPKEATASAPNEPAAPATEDQGSARFKAQSVNLNPIGALLGSYSVNYQHVFAGQHALLIEGRFATSSGDGVDTVAAGGAVGYRWLWSKEQDSGFVGLNIAYDNGTAETSVDGETYDVTLSQVSILPNIGRRWAWDGGFNITLRVGVGRAFRSLSTSSKSAEAQEAVKDVEEFLDILPVAFDGELSVGWIF